MATKDGSDLESLVGQRVRRIRELLGLTQTQLGVLANLGSGTQSLIAKLETGQRPIRVNEVEALARALRVPLVMLVEREPGHEAAAAGQDLERAQADYEELKLRESELVTALERTKVQLGRQEAELRRAEDRLAEVIEQEHRDRVERREES